MSQQVQPECNLERLAKAMTERQLDGLVLTQPYDVYYMSGFNATAHKGDEPRPYAFLVSREALHEPVLIVADYYLGNFLTAPIWVQDIRPFRAVMMPLDIAPRSQDIDLFIPASGKNAEWVERARRHFAFDMKTSVLGAVRDLGLEGKRIGFDDLAYGMRLGLPASALADAYDCMMDARSVKTRGEIARLERATSVNEKAIRAAISRWDPKMSWQEFTQVYDESALALGGFVRDPGGMVWGHPSGCDAAITLQTGREQELIPAGTHVMFDCHGTLDLYCWDGGKTWVAGADPNPQGARNANATAAVAETLMAAMRPGARISELQRLARDTYRKAGHPEPDSTLAFFHGLGLSHMDVPIERADGQSNADWRLEQDMVVPLHLLCPGGQHDRWWLEDVVHVTAQGGRGLFSWGFGPL
ncbi:MAG: M24 family metallopeptidase [Quisquiliibacterium sp.]